MSAAQVTATRQARGKGQIVTVVHADGRTATAGGNRAARAVVAVVTYRDGGPRLTVELRADAAQGESLARSNRRLYPSCVVDVVPIVDAAQGSSQATEATSAQVTGSEFESFSALPGSNAWRYLGLRCPTGRVYDVFPDAADLAARQSEYDRETYTGSYPALLVMDDGYTSHLVSAAEEFGTWVPGDLGAPGASVSDLIAAGQRWRAYFDEVPPQMRQARADWVAPLGFVYCASCVASDVVPRQLLDPVTARVVPWDVMGDPRRFAFVCDGCAAAGENGGQA